MVTRRTRQRQRERETEAEVGSPELKSGRELATEEAAAKEAETEGLPGCRETGTWALELAVLKRGGSGSAEQLAGGRSGRRSFKGTEWKRAWVELVTYTGL